MAEADVISSLSTQASVHVLLCDTQIKASLRQEKKGTVCIQQMFPTCTEHSHMS